MAKLEESEGSNLNCSQKRRTRDEQSQDNRICVHWHAGRDAAAGQGGPVEPKNHLNVQ